jgi:hypothetical protein
MSLAERAAMSLADRAEIVFLEPLTAGLFPTLETRISAMSLPVAALIFAFCAAVNSIRTSFAISFPPFSHPLLSQERGHPGSITATTVISFA